MTEDRTEIPQTKTEVADTENFGHKFGLWFEVTELTDLSSVFTLGQPNNPKNPKFRKSP
jgi:hypothetical protein